VARPSIRGEHDIVTTEGSAPEAQASADQPRTSGPDAPTLDNSTSKPSAARIYDYFIGGDHNWAIDRAAAEAAERAVPGVGDYARECRLVLGRVVRHVSALGYRQFVDLGAGLPAKDSVHELADRVRPEHDTRVVYVDNEPIAHAKEEILLEDGADTQRTHALFGDLLDYEDLWPKIVGTGLIDLTEPVVLLLSAVMHFMKDSYKPAEAIAFYRDRLPSGSLLMISQMTNENPESAAEEAALVRLVALYEKTTNPGQLRSREELEPYFGGWPMLEPGLVYAPAWHPDGTTVFATPSASRILIGVGRKP
jgi:O-methyltransferase involved in polyketide biosynthesis